jgi:2-amino-4-hydroxy-6-hydroxymethyldihydropteridine diphosphokinase
MATALVALGSNLGDRQRNLDDAVAQLGRQPNIVVLATSRWRETRPVGGPKDQAEFLNGAVLLGTSLTPHQLHAVFQQIESAAGRTREERWAPRTLDLDLLLYDDLVIDTPELTIPHPRMSFRRFVLEPASQIAPDMRHPTIGWTIERLRQHISAWSPYAAALAGGAVSERRAIASDVAASVGGRVVSNPAPLDMPSAREIIRRDMTFEQAAELLSHWTEPIRTTAWANVAVVSISDYWLNEAAFNASLQVDLKRLGDFASLSREEAARAAKPKLLIHLACPKDIMARWAQAGGDPFSPLLHRRRQSRGLRHLIATEREGPVLRLDGTKLDEAKDELVAAIQAMQ